MNCLYCSGPSWPLYEYDRIKKDPDHPSIKIYIIDCTVYLDIYKTMQFYPSFDIKYCPICGRRLK